jgi:glycosyltransferase involved in cell wall biosynthesis
MLREPTGLTISQLLSLPNPMADRETIATARPVFSIIIAVCNDWAPLDQCLRSLAQEAKGPTFEVIVVDDGSSEAAPDFIRRWTECYPLNVVRQPHAGISMARNRGVRESTGAVLLFVDADCRFQTNCLTSLASAIYDFPQHNYFQLHLVGDSLGVVGRAEELRLTMLQEHMLQPDGRIRYLNTAGFAVRRVAVDTEKGVFNPIALRAEDTFLMASLMQRGELPFYVSNATVQHAIPLSLMESLRKDIRSIFLEARTYDLIAEKGVKFRVSHRERLAMLLDMWKTSGRESIGRRAWFVVTGRQGLRLVASYAYRCLRGIRLISAKL